MAVMRWVLLAWAVLIFVDTGAAGFEPAIPGLGGRCIIQAILRAQPLLMRTIQDHCATQANAKPCFFPASAT